MEKSLKKLSLEVQVGTGDQAYHFTPEPIRFEFIYGIDPAGISPFERQLADLAEGAQVRFNLERTRLPWFFGSLDHQLRQSVGVQRLPAQLSFKVCLVSCKDTEPRELVQALARTCGHRCGGGCDCGCS